LLHELLPVTSFIAHLANPNYPPSEANIREVEAAARSIGRQTVVVNASTESEIDTAFAGMSQMRVGGIHVGADPFFISRRDQIVSLAQRYALPATYQQREVALAGGLISYGTSMLEAYRQMGLYAGRLLNGENVSELPVVQATKFELVINLQTARELGLDLPANFLARADEVIE